MGREQGSAFCAFSNDMPGSRKKGYLLIGVRNNEGIDGLKVDDDFGLRRYRKTNKGRLGQGNDRPTESLPIVPPHYPAPS